MRLLSLLAARVQYNSKLHNINDNLLGNSIYKYEIFFLTHEMTLLLTKSDSVIV